MKLCFADFSGFDNIVKAASKYLHSIKRLDVFQFSVSLACYERQNQYVMQNLFFQSKRFIKKDWFSYFHHKPC